jgi:hypothetical protein
MNPEAHLLVFDMEDTITDKSLNVIFAVLIYIPFANSDIYQIPSKSRQLRPVDEIRRVDRLGKHALGLEVQPYASL